MGIRLTAPDLVNMSMRLYWSSISMATLTVGIFQTCPVILNLSPFSNPVPKKIFKLQLNFSNL